MTVEKQIFALAVVHPGGMVGWLVGTDCDVMVFSSRDAAERYRKQLMKNDDYGWTCPVEVREFTEKWR